MDLKESSVTAEWKSSELSTLLPKTRRVSDEKAEFLRKCAVGASIFTLAVLGTLGIVTLVIGLEENSLPAFAFALDALLDCLSSIVVAWRFTGGGNNLYSSKREKTACVTLGALFIFSSLIIAAKAGYSISLGPTTDEGSGEIVIILSVVNFFICLGLAVFKIYLAYSLESISIATDAVNSGIGILLSLATIVSDVVYERDTSLWYLDSLIGILCAFILCVYGVWLIIHELLLPRCRAKNGLTESSESVKKETDYTRID